MNLNCRQARRLLVLRRCYKAKGAPKTKQKTQVNSVRNHEHQPSRLTRGLVSREPLAVMLAANGRTSQRELREGGLVPL